VHFVGLFLSSLLKMHGPKNKIEKEICSFPNTRTLENTAW